MSRIALKRALQLLPYVLLCLCVVVANADTAIHDHAQINNTFGARYSLPHNAPSVAQQAPAGPRLAIIMDDIGYNLPLGQRAVELPGAITYAVLPHTPLGNKLSRHAVRDHPEKEIIVHMPMQSLLDKRLGPGGLREDFDRDTFLQTLRAALQQVPHARGLSNHMGSYLTTLPDRMQWLMAELRERGLFYIDSKTTTRRTARNAARDSRVPYLARDIFLDHDPSPQAIEAAFEQAKLLARRNGIAVVVAHPYRNTLAFLEQQLPQLASDGYALVNASRAIDYRNGATHLARH